MGRGLTQINAEVKDKEKEEKRHQFHKLARKGKNRLFATPRLSCLRQTRRGEPAGLLGGDKKRRGQERTTND